MRWVSVSGSAEFKAARRQIRGGEPELAHSWGHYAIRKLLWSIIRERGSEPSLTPTHVVCLRFRAIGLLGLRRCVRA